MKINQLIKKNYYEYIISKDRQPEPEFSQLKPAFLECHRLYF